MPKKEKHKRRKTRQLVAADNEQLRAKQAENKAKREWRGDQQSWK